MGFIRTIAAGVALLIFTCALPVTAPADQLDQSRTLIGLAALGNFPDRTETIGNLPDHLLQGIPMPVGLEPLGGVVGSSGDNTTRAEALFFAAASGSVPNYAQYANQLTNAGWGTTTPPSVFAMPTTFATYCKTGSPMVSVTTSGSYLIVRAYSQGCASATVATAGLFRTTSASNRPPLPQLAPPTGSSFARSTISYAAGSSVAAATLRATQDLPTLLSLFSKQMTDGGWTQYGTAGNEGCAFMYRASSGRNWMASLAVVRTGSNEYALTISAFEVDPKNSI